MATISVDTPKEYAAYDNTNFDDIDEKPEGYYQELNDYQVQLPPLNSKLQRPISVNVGDPEDYHDSVEFEDLAIQHNRTATPVNQSGHQTRTKPCNTKNILLVISGIILFVIMIAIIGVLASHLVTDNDKQEKKLLVLESRISDEVKKSNAQNNRYETKLTNIEKMMNYVKGILNNSNPVKVAALIRNTSMLEVELGKLKNVISKIHCGVCQRQVSDKVLQGYICDCKELKEMRDCLEFYQHGFRVNGIYKVHQDHRKVISVYCDQSTDGGGWTVFQRRRDGSVLFNRDWVEYVDGFGDLENENWLGNQNLFTMTLQSGVKGNELRVELEDWDGVTKHAAYSSIKVDNKDKNFMLHVSDYKGTAGDSLTYSNTMPFSTKDKENDVHDQTHCASYHKGGWWYKRCAFANLNGEYQKSNTRTDTGIFWKTFRGMKYSLKYCEMKLRRKV